MGVWQQALAIGCHQTCEEDERKEKEALAGVGARMPSMGRKR